MKCNDLCPKRYDYQKLVEALKNTGMVMEESVKLVNTIELKDFKKEHNFQSQ